LCKNKSNLQTTANEVFNFVSKIQMRAIFLFIFFGFLVGSCSIPEVKEAKLNSIIIASDFLSSKDSLVFKNFEKRNKIKVYIKHLDSDSIIAHIKQYGYNATFDAVLLKSSYSLNRLSNLGFLNDLPQQFSIKPVAIRSPKNNWISIGFDPYVIDFGDSLVENVSYNELTHSKRWKPQLSEDESMAFYAGVLHKFGRKQMAKSKSWLLKLKQHEVSVANDSLKLSNFSLNRFSKSKEVGNNYLFPNQENGGVFYDAIGIGIIAHSRKYSEAERLINYVLIRYNNQAIAAKLNLFPVENPDNRSLFTYQNEYPRLGPCSPNKCVREYRDLEKVMMKLEWP